MRFKLVIPLLVVGCWLMLSGVADAASTGLAVTDMSHGATAQAMAQSLVGGGVSISNVQYTGASNAAGAFSGGTGNIGFESGIVLGSGSVQTTSTSESPCDGTTTETGVQAKGVEGPNKCDAVSTDNGAAGDSSLDTLSGKTTFDASVLQFDFVPSFSSIQFSYVFSSDEYNEYANSDYNDTFGFLVNGTNCALVPGTSTPVSVNTINGGNPANDGDPGPQNSQYYRDNSGGGINTEMDGLTTVLTCTASVNPGVTNHVKLAIADATDHRLDSNVFIEGGSFVSGTQIATSLSGGGQSGAKIGVPMGTSVTDSATLSGANSPSASGTVTYTVYSDSTCETVYADGGTKDVGESGAVPDSDPVSFPSAGTYYWRASYSGDEGNNPITSSCGSETVTVAQASPTIATQASSAKLGSPIHDTASLSGGSSPGGTVAFKAYGPDNPSCSGSAAFTDTEPITSGSATSADFTPTKAGSYYWTARYSGDSNNTAESSTCNADASETSTVTGNPPPPSADLSIVKTDSPDPVNVGQTLTYRLSAKDNGPANATGVVVTDTLPASVTFQSSTPSQGTCSRSGRTLTCALGALASGGSATVVVKVTPKFGGTITNDASVKANEPDGKVGNNSTSQSTIVREPVPPPQAGKTVNAKHATGIVLVECPGKPTHKLTGTEQVDMGCTLDATNGSVELFWARGNGTIEHGTFSEGAFVISQVIDRSATARHAAAHRDAAPVKFYETVLTLTGGQPQASCDPEDTDPRVSASRHHHRHTHSHSHGHVSTHSHHSAAAASATEWLMEECGDGTLTTVYEGVVKVTDYGTGKTVFVKAGHQYFARAVAPNTWR